MTVDYSKPIRWMDDKAPGTVLLRDGSFAWVIVPNKPEARLFDINGECKWSISVENIPEPKPPMVGWIVQWETFGMYYESKTRTLESFNSDESARAIFKFTFFPDDPRNSKIEVIEVRE